MLKVLNVFLYMWELVNKCNSAEITFSENGCKPIHLVLRCAVHANHMVLFLVSFEFEKN